MIQAYGRPSIWRRSKLPPAPPSIPGSNQKKNWATGGPANSSAADNGRRVVVHPEPREHLVIALQFVAPFGVLDLDLDDAARPVDCLGLVDRLLPFTQDFHARRIEGLLHVAKFPAAPHLLGQLSVGPPLEN